MSNMFIFIILTVSQVYTFVKTHQGKHFNTCSLCQLFCLFVPLQFEQIYHFWFPYCTPFQYIVKILYIQKTNMSIYFNNIFGIFEKYLRFKGRSAIFDYSGVIFE